ncbi:protein-L-isoaspartate O-methyltransferase [Dentipellis sp. KUC8613]|nr:protein-L-isoaspartate O-methyltransferase [Dentipellis sp. KUC8613]
MAWFSTGKTNSDLIANMSRNGILKSDRVYEAMEKVDRAHYVVDKADAYIDSPQYIGHGATISAPHMHAHAAEILLEYLRPGARVLDVGSGSAYLCSVFHRLVTTSDGAKGRVVGIEHIPELVEWSKENVRKDGLGAALDDGEIILVAGDGRQGYPEGGPYDAIHVGAAAPTLPRSLVDQLATPGRMFIPVGTGAQEVLQVDKHADGKVTEKTLFGVMYVPLTDRAKSDDGPR